MDIKPRPRRKSIRLKGYDYSRAGLYFVTICCHDRACLFGHISTVPPVGADLCVRPDDQTNVRPNKTNVRPNKTNVRPNKMDVRPNVNMDVRPNVNTHYCHVDNLYDYFDDNSDFNSHDHPDNNTKFDNMRTQSMDERTHSNNDGQTHSNNDERTQSINDGQTQSNNDGQTHSNNDGQTQSNNDGQTHSNNDGQTHSICGRTHRFAPTGVTDELGLITTPQMILNDAGRMVEKWYYELENKFPDIKCHEMVVMPNHIHFIIQNIHFITSVGAVVQWWKTMTTNEYIRGVKTSDWEPFFGKLWQRNYYEHIIRNEQSYHAICDYIRNNPEKWHDDKFCNK